MAELVGDEGYEVTTEGAVRTPGDADAVLPADAKAWAKYEHEVAALDLSEAEQLAAWAAAMAEQGDATESRRLADNSARLRASADRHRRGAEQLEREPGQDA
ncbi:MAG: hypothetical protein L0H96_02215 [Humibacillus sp.]|nr:hypothetical protein [Humibacillus sp.]MDN5775707.1 hypothetical protein [Humibacillus sp.]